MPAARDEFATAIADAVNAAEDKYTARAWRGGTNVRVYFRHARKGDLGHLAIGPAGECDWKACRGTRCQSRAEAATKGAVVTPDAPVAAPAARPSNLTVSRVTSVRDDEDVQDHMRVAGAGGTVVVARVGGNGAGGGVVGRHRGGTSSPTGDEKKSRS
jgi:uncharacterized protein (DUF4415 family)